MNAQRIKARLKLWVMDNEHWLVWVFLSLITLLPALPYIIIRFFK